MHLHAARPFLCTGAVVCPLLQFYISKYFGDTNILEYKYFFEGVDIYSFTFKLKFTTMYLKKRINSVKNTLLGRFYLLCVKLMAAVLSE